MRFGKISDIVPEDPSTWAGVVFLTFDIDWACDGILNDTLDVLTADGVDATFYVTHETPILERMRENKGIELGIHPNFNNILQGSNQNGNDAREIITRLMDIVPEAKSYRSHSLTISSYIQTIIEEVGITHDVNLFMPLQSVKTTPPFRLWDGLIKVPYIYCDYTACLFEEKKPFQDFFSDVTVPLVFDFHPIHVFLNTEDLERYEDTREFHKVPDKLIEFRSTAAHGSRSILKQIIQYVNS